MDLFKLLKSSKYYFKSVLLTKVQNPHPELGSYIYCLKILYNWTAIFLGSPVYLRYDQQTKMYVVQKCHYLQRISCAIATFCTTMSVISKLHFAGKTVIENSSYIVAYFDFFNECVLNIFIYAHVYIHWYQLNLLTSFVEVLQTTSLIKYCVTPTWKTKFLTTFLCAICIYLPTVWFIMYYGYDFTSFEGALRSSQVNAQQIFWYWRSGDDCNNCTTTGTGAGAGNENDGDADNAPAELPLILCVIGAIGRYHNGYLIHLTIDAFCLTNMFIAYFVVHDYFGALNKKGGLAPQEVLDTLEDFKILMKKLNKFSCVYTLNFIGMTLTYHSVHLFDFLNEMVLIWKISSYFYYSFVLIFYALPQVLLYQTRQLRKWLRLNDNCIKIPHKDLNSILYDLLDFQFGIRGGGFLILNSSFCGTTIGNMVSYSMLNMLSKED